MDFRVAANLNIQSNCDAISCMRTSEQSLSFLKTSQRNRTISIFHKQRPAIIKYIKIDIYEKLFKKEMLAGVYTSDIIYRGHARNKSREIRQCEQAIKEAW